MAELQLLEERTISGKGVLRVPDMDESFRYYVMYTDVIRDPRNQYSNYEWNPAQSFYARMVFRRSGYALFDDTIRYEKQCYQYVNDYSGQTLIAVKCAYDGILQSFVNLVNGLAGTPGGVGIFVTGVTDLIKDYENLQLGWDEVLFRCYTSAALQVRFYGLKYDTCDPDKDKKHTPPPPPPPLSKVPVDSSIGDLSPPYDPETGDDGDTDPYDGDETAPPTEACVKYSVPFSLTYNDGVGLVPVETFAIVFGIVGDYRVDSSNPTNWRLLLECQGQAGSPGDTCQLFDEYSIFEGGSDYSSVTVGEPTPI